MVVDTIKSVGSVPWPIHCKKKIQLHNGLLRENTVNWPYNSRISTMEHGSSFSMQGNTKYPIKKDNLYHHYPFSLWTPIPSSFPTTKKKKQLYDHICGIRIPILFRLQPHSRWIMEVKQSHSPILFTFNCPLDDQLDNCDHLNSVRSSFWGVRFMFVLYL